MTTTAQTPATQAELDAMTYDMYVDQGQNKAAAARQMGISASTVADRVKRHSLRLAQDTLADSIALDAEQAAQDAEYAADSEAAEQAPATEDPDESLVALLEDGEPKDDASEEDAALAGVREEAAQVRAMGSVPNPNEAHAVAIKLHAGRKNADAGPVAVTVDDTVVAVTQRVDITGQDGEAAEATPEPAKAEKVLVTECVRCGFHFSRPQARQTCQSDKACQRRQAAKVTA
jgi:transposase-like protein